MNSKVLLLGFRSLSLFSPSPSLSLYIYIYIHVCVYVCVCVCLNVYSCTYVHTHTDIYIYIYIYVIVYMNIYEVYLKNNGTVCAVWAISERGISRFYNHLTCHLGCIELFLAFCNYCRFFHMLLSKPLFQVVQQWARRNERKHRERNKPKIFSPVGEKSVASTFVPRGSQGDERWRQEREAFNKEDWVQCRTG